MQKANDLAGLLMLHSSCGNSNGIADLAIQAATAGKNNIAFICHFLLGDIDACIELLCETNRISEAAFLARTYQPSQVRASNAYLALHVV